MKIFRAIGFVIFIITVRILMPEIFHAFQDAIIQLFSTFETVMSVSQDGFANGNLLPAAVSYPQIPVN